MPVYELPTMAAVHVAACKPSIVKVSHPYIHDVIEIPVLHSESGAVYAVDSLIRTTRLGSVHVAHRLLKIPGNDFHVRSAEKLAVKTYNKRALLALQTKKGEENPVNEMIALSLLSQRPHANVLQIAELFSDAEFFYMIMPLVSGGDLLDVMEHQADLGLGHCFSTDLARTLVRDVASGLSFLHSHGIAHRDLSIENILFDEENKRFVIIDLGMCLRLPRDDSGRFCSIPARPICGKRNYIAPEVWQQRAAFDPTLCDVWALGVILFMVLTASAPMEQATDCDPHYAAIAEGRVLDVLLATLQDEADENASFEERVSALDTDLLLAMDLVQKILRPEPTQRLTLAEILAHPWLAQP